MISPSTSQLEQLYNEMRDKRSVFNLFSSEVQALKFSDPLRTRMGVRSYMIFFRNDFY
jgi:hypothetical protein